ncbi:hypothetical protein O3P69_002466 [Scylla paramamosain]|uniref:Uncharacterized protein n=1 Tax=Scylla paramamosain TaxID=85552 RepID=A0AAW0UKS6_SCYPA
MENWDASGYASTSPHQSPSPPPLPYQVTINTTTITTLAPSSPAPLQLLTFDWLGNTAQEVEQDSNAYQRCDPQLLFTRDHPSDVS